MAEPLEIVSIHRLRRDRTAVEVEAVTDIYNMLTVIDGVHL